MATERIAIAAPNKQQIFGLNTFVFNPGTKLVIDKVNFVYHKIDDKLHENQVPILECYYPSDWVDSKPKEGATVQVIYLRSFLKVHRDYKGNIVPIPSTLGDFVRQQAGKTEGELEIALNAYHGKQIKASVTTIYKINKRGDVQPVDINGWDFVD